MKNTKEISIKIEGQEWKDALEVAFEKANGKVKIDGFRQGKAPRDVFMKKYGEESLYMDAADASLEKAYTKMLNENDGLELVAQPEVNIKSIDKEGVEFVFILTTKPEVKLGKYTGLKVKKEEIKVAKEEIDKTIEEMRNRYAENVVKEGKITNGDVAVIDFEGFKDGTPFDGGKGENYSLKIGSGTFIPGFEEQLIGLSAGDEKDVELSFPEDYHSEELKGEKVTFKVKVNEVKSVVIPELGDEFFADLGLEGITDIKGLEKQVEDNIKARKDSESDNKYIDELLEAVSKNTEIDIPEVMIKEEINRMMKQYEENLKMQGFTLELFYQYTNSDETALRDQMKEEAEKRVKYRLTLEEIAKVEKLEPTADAVAKEAEELASKYKMTKEEFLQAFGGIDMVKYDMTMRAAIELIKK